MSYRALLFDLFRTVLLFDAEAPSNRVTEPSWRPAMEALRVPMSGLLPGVDFDRFLDALVEVTEEVGRRRPPEYFELPCAERYRRACARLGIEGPEVAELAEQAARLQMAQLMAHAHLPDESRRLLHELAGRHRLGLISNFDHAETIWRLLARFAIGDLFAVTLVSIEFGRRKPHPSIFAEALRRLEVDAGEALYVGDSLIEDVDGARAAGLDAVWINPSAAPLPAGHARPMAVIAQLADLRGVLRSRASG